jgi:hypothetical protein
MDSFKREAIASIKGKSFAISTEVMACPTTSIIHVLVFLKKVPFHGYIIL